MPDEVNAVYGVANGVLWQGTDDQLIARRVSDAGDPLRIDVGSTAPYDVPTTGFGAAWTEQDDAPGSLDPAYHALIITRFDAKSGRRTSVSVRGQGAMTLQYGNAFRSLVAGPTAIWFLEAESTRLYRLDPVTLKVTSWATGR